MRSCIPARWLMRVVALALAIHLGPIAQAKAAAPQIKSGCLDRRVQADPALAAAVDRIVADAVEEGFAGQVAIASGAHLVYSRAAGFSDRRHEVPVTAATLFQVSSVTKYLTAALFMTDLDAGRVEVADTIAALAPGTRMATRGTTYGELLSHRSGLGSSYVAEGVVDADAALTAIDGQPFEDARRGAFHYSNDGYDVLAILIERLEKRAYEALVRERLFEPACMHAARLWTEVDVRDPHRVGQPLDPISTRLIERNYGFLGSQGLLVSAEDLVAFQVALERGRILTPSSYRKLVEPRVKTSIGMAAYGAFVAEAGGVGKRIAALGAEDWGDNAILAAYPDCGFVVSVVTSKGPADVDGKDLFRQRISRAIEPLLAQRCHPSGHAFVLPNTEVVDLATASNGIDYQLYVQVPPACRGATIGCPAVFLLDADYPFPLASTIVTHLTDRDRIPPLISIAIAYPDKSHCHRDRTREYTPFFFPDGGYGTEMQQVSGGGPAFLRVIEREIIPYVQTRYPASAEHRTMVGHSYGGLFATYAWIGAPQLFENFLIVSPSLRYVDRTPLKAVARACEGTPFDAERHLFLAVGHLEEQPENGRAMVGDLRAMHGELTRCRTRKVASRIEVFDDETHASIFPAALSSGLRAFFQ